MGNIEDIASFRAMGAPGTYRGDHCYTVVGYRHASDAPVVLADQDACESDFQVVDGKIGRLSDEQDEQENDTLRVMQENELWRNYISSYRRVFEEGKSWQMFFMDDEWVIIDGAIDLPNGWDTWTKRKKQTWLDWERGRLAEKYGLSPDEENMRALSAHGVVQNGQTMKETVLQNANQQVIGDPQNRTRLQYLRDEFKHTTGDAAIDAFLSRHIVWLVAGESSFDNSSLSKSRAFGIFQFMEGNTINNKKINPKQYSRAAVEKSLILQTELAKNYMSDSYGILKKYTQIVAERYFSGDQKKAKEYFIGPLIINMYNTGAPNIQKVLEGFFEAYPDQESLATEYGFSYDTKNRELWYDAFVLLTQFGRASRWAHTYGGQSSAYVFKSLAYSQILGGAVQDPLQKYIPPESRKTKEWGHFSVLKKLRRIFNRIFPEKSPSPETPEMPSWDLLVSSKKYEKPQELWRMIQASVITPYLQAFKDQYHLKKMRNSSDFSKYLDPLPEPQPWAVYSLHGLGKSVLGKEGKTLSGENNSDYLYLHKEAQKRIRDIQGNLEYRLHHELGLDPRYRVVIPVTSAVRDEEYVKKYLSRRASPNSSHLYGIAFDTRKVPRIFDTKEKKFIKYSLHDSALLENTYSHVIYDMENLYGPHQWSLFVNYESDHIHITVRLDNGKWIPPADRDEE